MLRFGRSISPKYPPARLGRRALVVRQRYGWGPTGPGDGAEAGGEKLAGFFTELGAPGTRGRGEKPAEFFTSVGWRSQKWLHAEARDRD